MHICLEALMVTEFDKVSRTDSRVRWFKPPDAAVGPKKNELDKCSSADIRLFVSSLSVKEDYIIVLERSSRCTQQPHIQI
jgi:hypothetical protein